MKYSIVIPCYNEEANLERLVSSIVDFGKNKDVEFVLVENGSKDNSRKKMQELISQFSFIKMTTIDQNIGYGYGVEQGIKAASGDYIGWIHADMQLAITELNQFFDYIDKNCNLDTHILLKGKRYNRSFMDYFFTNGMAIFESLLLGQLMTDIQSIPTIFDKSLLPYLEKAPNDFSHDLFVYYIAKKNNYNIVKLPVKIVKRVAGNSSWNTGILSRIKLSNRIISQSLKMKNNL